MSQPSRVSPVGQGAVSCRPAYEYGFYGVSLRSELPLPYQECAALSEPDVALVARDDSWFARVRAAVPAFDTWDDWYEYGALPDGSDYLCWSALFQFVVSADGREIAVGFFGDATPESFQTYLLGPVLSFALVKQGYEPLHSTVVVVDGKAVAFLADSGSGKSTLAASFLHAGHQLLTDDLLLIREVDGVLCGFPGPARLKLYPEIASRFQPDRAPLGPMYVGSDKLLVPLRAAEVSRQSVHMHALVVLDWPEQPGTAPELRPLSGHDALVAIVASSFNVRLSGPARLTRQFTAAQLLAKRVPVLRLTYPRDFSVLPAVRQLIRDDVARGSARAA